MKLAALAASLLPLTFAAAPRQANAQELVFLSTQLRPIEEAQKVRDILLEGAPKTSFIVDEPSAFSVRMKAERPLKLSWTMTRGEMMKENSGSWTLKPVAGGTEATYDIDLKLGALVPSFIEKALAESSLPGMLQNFKKQAEKLYPKAGA